MPTKRRNASESASRQAIPRSAPMPSKYPSSCALDRIANGPFRLLGDLLTIRLNRRRNAISVDSGRAGSSHLSWFSGLTANLAHGVYMHNSRECGYTLILLLVSTVTSAQAGEEFRTLVINDLSG